MRKYTTVWLTGFCVSALSAVFWPALPSVRVMLAGITVSTLYLVATYQPMFFCVPRQDTKSSSPCYLHRNRQVGLGLHGVVAGAVWMASVGYWYTGWQLPQDKIQQDVIVVGEIIEAQHLPNVSAYVIAASYIDSKPVRFTRKLQLYWRYPDKQFAIHQKVQVLARLKPAYGLANPGGVSRQQWLASKAVVATGSLRTSPQNKLIEPASSLHYSLSSYLQRLGVANERWFRALLIGDRSGLKKVDWDLLQITGTAHLFSLSGLHIGIVATSIYLSLGVIYLLTAKMVMRRAPRANLNRFLALPIILLCGYYAHLANWLLPITRAFILLCVYVLLQRSQHHWATRHRGLIMVFLCILCFPLSLLSASFYLSAGAVVIIWFIVWRQVSRTMSWKQRILVLTKIQFALSALMLPLTMGWFGLVSWLAPIVNLLLVPIISLLLPIFLLVLVVSQLAPALSAPLWNGCDWIMGCIIDWLAILAANTDVLETEQVEIGVMYGAFLSTILLFMPQFRFRLLCASAGMLPLVSTFLTSSVDNWQLHVFDVGQGTAVAVSRGSRAIIIDTGASFLEGASMAEQVLIPSFSKLRITTIDHIFISHGDNDHAGGLAALNRHQREKRKAEPRLHTTATSCVAGESLQWQQLTVEVLWPKQASDADTNNTSCVIRISDAHNSVLLPGDIERTSEYGLVYQYQQLKTDVLIAPHHGSATSSTDIFTQLTAPQYVVFTQGFANRWQFPAASVGARYRKVNALPLATSYHGYIRFLFSATGELSVSTQRQDLNRRWYTAGRPPLHWLHPDL